MPKVIVSIDEVVIKEVQLTKDRTTLGRRPYNDIVIDNLAISGEHAVFLLSAGQVTVEDLNSTNGTYLNGRAIKKQLLSDGDSIEVGKYKVKFVGDASADNFDKTMVVRARPQVQSAPVTEAAPSGYSTQAADSTGLGAFQASIKVMSGAAAGREVPLTKVVTTIGTWRAVTLPRQQGVVHQVEGAGNPSLNGAPISATPIALKNGDLIELAGTQMQFVLA
jgi:pSer/pThr/pTyr-binding forkhead associated (FHA) protein